MGGTFRLFAIIGKAALIVTVGCIVLILPILIGFRLHLTPAEEGTAAAVAVFLPTALAARWMFLKMRALYPPREARAISIAFGVFTPISLLIALAVSPMFGFSELLVGRSFVLIGVFVGIAVLTALLSFLVCAAVLRVTRLIVSVEQSDRT